MSDKKIKLSAEDRPKVALAYQYGSALYLNITHRCPTACTFCIKFSWNWMYRGNNLLLKSEPGVEEILAAVGDPSSYSEIVFCGYGESTYRLEDMKVIARELKRRNAKRLRLNTIGLGSAIHKRNIAPELAQFLDGVMISLNTADPKEWVEIHRPAPEFAADGFQQVCAFIQESARHIPETFVTAVERPGWDAKPLETLVHSLGARVRLRPYLDEYESQ